MVALVTGATGFIGSAVVRRLLARGQKVRALVRPTSPSRNIDGLDIQIAVGDLLDYESLEAALEGVSHVYHVAADYRLWARNPDEIYDTNVEGTHNLLVCAAKRDLERIVFTSSVCTLGLGSGDEPADEDTPSSRSDMIGAYKKSKFDSEAIAMHLARKGAPIVIVNPSAPVGPRDIKPTPTGRMVLEAATGKMPAFIDTGLNIVHVDDVAEGHLLAAERGIIGERYILGGENWTLRQILHTIAELTGRRPPRIQLPRRPLYPLAYMAEGFCRLSGRGEPFVTLDGLRLAKHRMFFSSDKAIGQFGYRSRPARDALRDAVAGFGIAIAQGAERPLVANRRASV